MIKGPKVSPGLKKFGLVLPLVQMARFNCLRHFSQRKNDKNFCREKTETKTKKNMKDKIIDQVKLFLEMRAGERGRKKEQKEEHLKR